MADASEALRHRTPWMVKAVLLIGAALLGAALVLAVGQMRFLAASQRATGTVSAVTSELMRDADGRVTGSGYRITVAFPDDRGRTVSVRSPVTSSSTSRRVGDRIDVDYPPGRPERAVIATFADRWLAPLVLAFIGGVAALIGGLGVWMARQPGTRFYGNGRTNFAMTLGETRMPDPADLPPTPPPVPGGRGNLPWIAAALLVALATGFFLARATAPDPAVSTVGNVPPSDLRVTVPVAAERGVQR